MVFLTVAPVSRPVTFFSGRWSSLSWRVCSPFSGVSSPLSWRAATANVPFPPCLEASAAAVPARRLAAVLLDSPPLSFSRRRRPPTSVRRLSSAVLLGRPLLEKEGIWLWDPGISPQIYQIYRSYPYSPPLVATFAAASPTSTHNQSLPQICTTALISSLAPGTIFPLSLTLSDSCWWRLNGRFSMSEEEMRWIWDPGKNSNAEKMGKKGSWFSAIKRVFTHESKDKPSYGSDKRSSKEKKAGKGVIQYGEPKSFISRFREPSSIEKILGEADELLVRPPPASSAETKKIPLPSWRLPSPAAVSSPSVYHKPTSPNAPSQRVSSARFTSPKAGSPRAVPPPAPAHEASQSRWEIRYVQRPEMTLRNQHRSATMIQAAFRGYLARRNFRALRGLMRLQGVVRSPNAQRQTMNAMKQMQLLVRVQTQIQSRRIQMLENQHQAYRNTKEMDSNLNQLPEVGYNDDWDDSLLTKEEIEARVVKKIEAVMKRERAMAYAYSHQLWKANPRSTQTLPDIRSNGHPWWWSWLERQLPPPKTVTATPPRPVSQHKTRPQTNASNHKRGNMSTESHEAIPPQSSKSTTARAKTPQPVGLNSNYYSSMPRGSPATAGYDFPLRDDESLTTYPPFSTPNYMTPTASAKAKARANSNPKERLPGTPANESKRRFSFSLTSNIGSLKWNKGSGKETANKKALEKHVSSHFGGDLSVDSTVSMPAAVGRRPFNRFV